MDTRGSTAVDRPHIPEENDAVLATANATGDRWTLLILREAFFGVRRFVDIQRNLGIARTQLSERLCRLVDQGVLERVEYQTNPVRHDYRLTPIGLDLYPLIVAMLRFGETWLIDHPTVRLTHRDCGGDVELELRCAACHQPVTARTADYAATPEPA